MILFVLILDAVITMGQDRRTVKTYHKTEVLPSYGQYAVSNTSTIDIVFQVIDKDSVVVIHYATSSGDKHQTIRKEEYAGTCRSIKDTLKVIFTESSIHTKNRIGKIDSISKPISLATAVREYNFLMEPNAIKPLDAEWLPVMMRSTRSRAKALHNRFANWNLR